ncbi:MATE family efflux transporter [Flammeovirga kamogawensis]|uniref:Multidrug-efflux transporter n=1 Tax=Flammeovirga kamogawensis TaxID=373891 RepID=A0ABX8GZH2_9BACT|nr:MATE family efflux transporter [Flammeovirga kamogawensis]MBB6462873.1 putative MATE family efflux protein [Flammeovirga kamogawensis]QWG08345.1 MATE family efflux transporter [Flammeovirga kamogawensis]TRX66642.1 MATE family efflux transporter [Flammeovirga kamogawensis]
MKKNQKAFYQEVWKVAIPISLQSLLQYALSMVDQIMVGQLGESVIAGVGLGGRLSFVLIVGIMGLANGAGVFVAQYWGRKEKEKVNYLIGDLLKIGFFVTLVGMLVSLLFPSEILSLFSTDQEVVAIGGVYQQIIAFGFPAILLSASYSAALRSVGHAKLVMKWSFVKVIINTIVNYWLIFGGFGIPPLGMVGAAWATVFSMWFEAIALFIIIRLKNYPGNVRLKHLFHFDKTTLYPLLSVSAPLILGDTSWAIGETCYSMIYGRMGTTDIASMTITLPLQTLGVGFFMGLASASAIVIGFELGQNNMRRAKVYGDKLLRFTFFSALAVAVIMAALSPLYINLFQITPEVRQITQWLVWIFTFLLPVKMCNFILAAGILRSGGDTKYTTVLGLISTWVISLPMGVLAAFVFDLPIYWVYIVVSLEEYFRLVLYIHRKKSGKWARNLTS